MTISTGTPAAEHTLRPVSLDMTVELLRASGLTVEAQGRHNRFFWDHPETGVLMELREVIQCVCVEFEGRPAKTTTATVILPAHEPIVGWVRVLAGNGRQFRYLMGTNPYDSGIQPESFEGSMSTWDETRPMFTNEELIEFFGFMPPLDFLV